jgi:hypothetical protein
VTNIRSCRANDRAAILSIINAAAEAYRGVIPADRWHEPYMHQDELNSEIAAGVTFWGHEDDGVLVGVMGRAEMGKNAGRKKEEVDEDYKQAAALAALVAPYRHARLSAVKLAGDPNRSLGFKDDASAAELREEIMRRLAALQEAGVLDLEALPAPDGEKPVSRSPASINRA